MIDYDFDDELVREHNRDRNWEKEERHFKKFNSKRFKGGKISRRLKERRKYGGPTDKLSFFADPWEG